MSRKNIQRKPKKCSHTRKTIYISEDLANRGKMWIWSRDPQADINDLHVYKCDYALHYHIGHKSYYQKVQERIHENFPQTAKI